MKILPVLCMFSILSGFAPAFAAETIPTPGTVTLLDLGSDCVPCDLQDRIVRRIEKEFEGKVSVIYLDVEKHPEYKQTYRIDMIPTLIFYDTQGTEQERRTGYMKESSMRKLLKTMTEK